MNDHQSIGLFQDLTKVPYCSYSEYVQKMSDNQGGYTLLELVVVIIVLFILVALIVWR